MGYEVGELGERDRKEKRQYMKNELLRVHTPSLLPCLCVFLSLCLSLSLSLCISISVFLSFSVCLALSVSVCVSHLVQNLREGPTEPRERKSTRKVSKSGRHVRGCHLDSSELGKLQDSRDRE